MKIGDKVRFLNDVGGGKITGFRKGNVVLVEDEDGFEIPALMDEVVVITTNEYNFARPQEPQPEPQPSERVDGKQYLKSKQGRTDEDEVDENLEARVLRLEMTIRQLEMRLARLEDSKAAREKERIEAKQQRKAQKDEILEVDLHAHNLLDNTNGMTPGDIKEYQLKTFRHTMDTHIKEKGRRIVFIHGKGDGVLRRAILDELKRSYKTCDSQDASFQQYGFGATMVTIH